MSDQWSKRAKVLTQIGISAIVLIVSLYIVLNDGYSESAAKWAYGMVGLVVGYWLK